MTNLVNFMFSFSLWLALFVATTAGGGAAAAVEATGA